MEVRQIDFNDVKPWLLEKHYARRVCPVSFAFGLFVRDKLEGIVTFGKPASPPLRNGICGKEYAKLVFELNRLCINSTAPKNAASMIISRAIKQLPKDLVLVSFADTAQGHVGYVYQATNWIYTGLSAKRTDWKIKGMEHLHGATIADMSRGRKERAKFMREKFGDRFYLADRPRKHRYVFFKNKKMTKYLKYPVLPYPKGDSKRYTCCDI
jgi:hypothetical protein